MKSFIKNILPLSILFLIGCEFMPDKDNHKPTIELDLEALAKELTVDLGLNPDQESLVYSSLKRGRRFHPHPASLWELAVDLSTSLTEAQIEHLLTIPEDKDFHDISYGLKAEDHEHSKKKDDCFNDIIRTLLNEDQLEFFNNYLSYRTEQAEILKESFDNGDIEFADLILEIKALHELFKTQLEILLTDDQEEQLRSIMEESRLHHHRKGDDSEKLDLIKEAMEDALNLTDEQKTELETIRTQFEIFMDEIKTALINNEITDEVFRVSVVELLNSIYESRSTVFTEEQKLIIDIHRAIAIRAHHHYFNKNG